MGYGAATYALLKVEEVVLGEGVGLGDDGDKVDAGAEALHDLNVEGFEAGSDVELEVSAWQIFDNSRMAGGTNEVETCVDAEVGLLVPLGLLLLPHIGLVLVVDELDDGQPRVAVVDVVTKSRGVDDGELDLELLLLELCLDDLDLGELVHLLHMAAVVVLGG